jgi:Tfp pilus assembly PilM family ATPase/Tfp pilus assembly protein PilN
MKITTLNISSNVIKYIATNGNGKVKHGSISPEGLINNGLILQPDTIASQIKSLFASNALPKDKVICSINGLPFSYRLFTLPKMEPAAFSEAVIRVIRKEMPISPDEMYLLWQAYPAENNEWQVLVAGITRQPVDNLVKTLLAAGIRPYFLDLQHLSLARLTSESDAVIVECEKDYSNIVMLVGGVPQALHVIPSLGPQAAVQDEIRQVIGRLNKMVNFYNGNHPKNPIKDTAKILLTGELVNDKSLIELVQQEVNYPVELLAPTNKEISDLPANEYAVNAGSLLMKVLPEKQVTRNTAPYRSINLGRITRELQGAAISSLSNKVIFGSIAAFVGIAALIFAFLSQNQVRTEIGEIQAQLDQANAAYNMSKSALDATQSVQNHIAEIKDQINLANSSYQSILDSPDYVSDIAAITQSEPEGILFTSLDIGSKQITVHGRADTPFSVVRFARSLELIGGFAKAEIERIDWASGGAGPAFSFYIIINK